MLIIARDTTHASLLMEFVKSEKFFEGRYRDKVIQVDSSKSGAEEDEMIQKLLAVESPEEPTEIVIHVNMLKEGWDVTNLYTIVPLRAANARILIEQSIGRGLRLPYGKRTGMSTVDRLNIVAHDRFQEIIDEANKPDSVIRLTQVILDPTTDLQKTQTVVVQSNFAQQIGIGSAPAAGNLPSGASTPPAAFASEAEQKVAQAVYQVIKKYQSFPASSHLLNPQVQEAIVKETEEYVTPIQQELAGVTKKPDVAAVAAKTINLLVNQTIDIPRILVVPKGEVTTGFHRFTLDCSAIHYQPVERDILLHYIRTNSQETLNFGGHLQQELRLEDYVVRGLMDFDDISYDEHADLLYDLSGQVVRHLRTYLAKEDTQNVLVYYQKQLAAFVHAQMQNHQWEKVVGYDVVVSKGFTDLKEPAYTQKEGDPINDFRQTVAEKSKIPQMLFGGFKGDAGDAVD
ncbi:MAG TPA: type III restriction endonuclease subunit R, partial [Candidatus Binatia bacterium]|nr:type III restriction endonuclease subunit R [Candidatus Binatia bacterium]